MEVLSKDSIEDLIAPHLSLGIRGSKGRCWIVAYRMGYIVPPEKWPPVADVACRFVL